VEFGSAEFKWATTDEGKEALRELRANAPEFKELILFDSAWLFRFLYAARASFCADLRRRCAQKK
jgi:hypothetical protein